MRFGLSRENSWRRGNIPNPSLALPYKVLCGLNRMFARIWADDPEGLQRDGYRVEPCVFKPDGAPTASVTPSGMRWTGD